MSSWKYVHIKKEEGKNFIKTPAPCNGVDLIEELEALFKYKEKPYCVAISYASDTSDMAETRIYKFKDDELHKIDEFCGYEGAFGADVTGMIKEKYEWNIYPFNPEISDFDSWENFKRYIKEENNIVGLGWEDAVQKVFNEFDNLYYNRACKDVYENGCIEIFFRSECNAISLSTLNSLKYEMFSALSSSFSLTDFKIRNTNANCFLLLINVS